MSTTVEDNIKPDYDAVITEIANYVLTTPITSHEAYDTARLCLMDSFGCGILALQFDACKKLLGPVVPGAIFEMGVPIPGVNGPLEPVQAAFNLGTMIRWLDFNDTWLAAEWGHPSDNLGAILSLGHYVSMRRLQEGKSPLVMQDILTAMIKAHEIQGCLALENSLNRRGLDHVMFVKVASTAVSAMLLGLDKDGVQRALSQAFVDGQSLRTYRHAPNAGSRKSWAAGDATARAVRLALMTEQGEMGYPSALTAPHWGFYDVLFAGKPFAFQRPYNSYVMENVLFKLSFPAEFHAQTAVECAVALHEQIKDRINEIKEIELITHESAIRIISKQGVLHNPADRDHCLQYMVAIGLLKGHLTAEDYEDHVAADPRIDFLRSKMKVMESPQFSKDYHDPEKRSIANSIQITFNDFSQTDCITIEYPIGHRRRRKEGIPVLMKKFEQNLLTQYSLEKVQKIIQIMQNTTDFPQLSVIDFMNLWK